jgi:hypothetical protein
LRETRQIERRLIARELFWWSTDRKYELGRVIEREGEERLRVANLKLVYWGLMNACSEMGGKQVGQKNKLGSKKVKLLLECTEKEKR